MTYQNNQPARNRVNPTSKPSLTFIIEFFLSMESFLPGDSARVATSRESGARQAQRVGNVMLDTVCGLVKGIQVTGAVAHSITLSAYPPRASVHRTSYNSSPAPCGRIVILGQHRHARPSSAAWAALVLCRTIHDKCRSQYGFSFMAQ